MEQIEDVAVGLLWGDIEVPGRKPTCQTHGKHIPSHLATPEIEPESHWWEARVLTFRPDGELK